MNEKTANAGRVVLVAGGTGNIGEELVLAFLKSGATVAVPSRNPKKLDKLAKFLGNDASDRMIKVVGDVSVPKDAERIRKEVLKQTGKLDAVAATLGGWWQGESLLDVSLSTWNEVLQSVLTTHFVAAQAFIPALLKHGGAYTLINGLAAEWPVPQAGPVSVAGAGQLMLGRALAFEMEPTEVRVNELVLGAVMTRVRGGKGEPEWVTGEEVGDFVVRLSFGSEARGEIFRLVQRDDLAGALAAL